MKTVDIIGCPCCKKIDKNHLLLGQTQLDNMVRLYKCVSCGEYFVARTKIITEFETEQDPTMMPLAGMYKVLEDDTESNLLKGEIVQFIYGKPMKLDTTKDNSYVSIELKNNNIFNKLIRVF